MSYLRKMSLEDIVGELERSAEDMGNRLADMKSTANWIHDEAKKLGLDDSLNDGQQDVLREIAGAAWDLVKAMG